MALRRTRQQTAAAAAAAGASSSPSSLLTDGKSQKESMKSALNDQATSRDSRKSDSTFCNVEQDSDSHEHGSDSEMRKRKSASNSSPGGEESSSLGELLRGPDGWNVLVLTFLYILQGIPLGLAGSMPLIIQNRPKASYGEQAFFSFVFWPFSLKLFWAPLVDSIYARRFGRRKSWLVPVQYLIAITMAILSQYADHFLGLADRGLAPLVGADGSTPAPGEVNIMALTAMFFGLTFLAATQDIAVDGWALTMLSRENVGWASTCNTVGQTAGYFLANVIFLALESADFCNNYLRSKPEPTGLVTLSGFLSFWAVVFFISTTLVAVLKSERTENDEEPDGLLQTYRTLYQIIKLPTVLKYCCILLTYKIGFAATDSISGLKLIEAGMPKDKLAMLGVPMVPIQIVLPVIISKYTAGSRPLSIFIKAIPFRLFMGAVFTYIVYITPSMKTGEHEFTYSFYALLLISYALHQVSVYCMFTAVMSFHAKISDPAIGGTYMTLLNTVSNMGGNWCNTLALYLVEKVTIQTCIGSGETTSCSTYLDGFYIETFVCMLIGILSFPFVKRGLNKLQSTDISAWTVRF